MGLIMPHHMQRILPGNYLSKVLSLGPIRHWPCDDEAESSIAREIVEGDDGSPYNVTFGVPGIGDGRTAARFAGNGYINIYSSDLVNNDLDMDHITLLIWLRINNVSVWTDGQNQYGFFMRGADDWDEQFGTTQHSADNNLRWARSIGGITYNHETTAKGGSTDWFCMAMTADQTLNEKRAYLDGVELGTALAAPTWTQAISSSYCCIGAVDTGATYGWEGDLAHITLFNYALSDMQIAWIFGGF